MREAGARGCSSKEQPRAFALSSTSTSSSSSSKKTKGNNAHGMAERASTHSSHYLSALFVAQLRCRAMGTTGHAQQMVLPL